jgi:hypothetical protein
MNKTILILTVIIITISFSSCESEKESTSYPIREYIPADKELYNTIVSMDRNFLKPIIIVI